MNMSTGAKGILLVFSAYIITMYLPLVPWERLSRRSDTGAKNSGPEH